MWNDPRLRPRGGKPDMTTLVQCGCGTDLIELAAGTRIVPPGQVEPKVKRVTRKCRACGQTTKLRVVEPEAEISEETEDDA